MRPVRLSCAGFRLGRLSVPAFQVSEGELVCLHVPPGCGAGHEKLIRLLSQGRDTPDLTFFGTVAWAERPGPQRVFLRRWRNPRIMDWLIRSARLSHDQALQLLRRWNERPDARVGSIQWNPRTWMALSAAFTRGANIVIFDTSGNDPSGIRIAYDIVASHLSSHAVLHVSHHHERERLCFPSARCVELIERAPTTLTRLS